MCAILTGIKSVMRVLARARLIAHIKSSKLGNLPKQFLKALFIPFCEIEFRGIFLTYITEQDLQNKIMNGKNNKSNL